MRDAIPYEEIIAKWNQKDDEFWLNVKYILSTIGYTQNPYLRTDWKRKLIGFVNNYIKEQSVIDGVTNLIFYDGDFDHQTLHIGNGNSDPDFVDVITGVTYELKSFKNFEDYNAHDDARWHHCNKKIIYFKDEHKFYFQKEDGYLWPNDEVVLYRRLMRPLEIDLD